MNKQQKINQLEALIESIRATLARRWAKGQRPGDETFDILEREYQQAQDQLNNLFYPETRTKKKVPAGFAGLINPNGKLEHITAPDLFEGENRLQVFNAKTGAWIGTVINGHANIVDPGEDQSDPSQGPEEQDPNQLNLF